jgi:hypothetical protein
MCGVNEGGKERARWRGSSEGRWCGGVDVGSSEGRWCGGVDS